jgi:hypothetical protein
MQKVSIIIPTINEEATIGAVIDSIPKGWADIEIIVVDTNSTDRTVEIALSKGAKVINEPKRGYGIAYKTGFVHASGDIIVTLDADLTYPADKIPYLVQMLLKEDLDFITCDRLTNISPSVMSFKHKFGNWFLTKTANMLFGLNLKDSQSGMWIFKKSILKHLRLVAAGMAFSEEIKIEVFKKGFKAKEIPIQYKLRKGESKLLSWRDGIGNLKFIFKKALNQNL